MLKSNFEIARNLVDQYNEAYLQWETMLHIQERLDEKIKQESKTHHITIDEDGLVTDVDKQYLGVCECCWANIRYTRINFTRAFLPSLVKVMDHVIEESKKQNKRVNMFNVKDLNFTHTEYTSLNRIANFGLLYRDVDEYWNRIKDGTYGVPVKRIVDFLNWDWKVAKFYVVKSNTHERKLSKERVTIDQIKSDFRQMTEHGSKKMPWYIQFINNDDVQWQI